MKNYDAILILAGLFILRIIIFSATYPDALCLIGILSYISFQKFLNSKQALNNFNSKIEKMEIDTVSRINELASEVVKIKNTAEGIKTAASLLKR